MQKNIISLEISSPSELKKQLEEFSKNKKQRFCTPRLKNRTLKGADKDGPLGHSAQGTPGFSPGGLHFAELKIYGSGVLVRQFDLPPLNGRDLVNALRLEAVEIFSLPAQTIELDYKVIDCSADRIKGIFIAMPTERLNEYAKCFASASIIPVKMTARCISSLGKFLAGNPEAIKNNFCFLNFSKSNTINLAVFINGQCELIREITYENFADAERAVLDSLKYSYGRSVTKQLNKLYFSGDMATKEDLIKRLEKTIEIEPKSAFADDSSGANKAPYHELFSKLNLLKKNSFILPVRNSLLRIGKVLGVAGLVFCVFLGIGVMRNARSIKELRSSINPADYEYARQLQQKLKVLNHGQ